jgi:rSAM/selenodomain-associated transferase 1
MELAQLAVFVRPPDEGAVKTRLAGVLGTPQAAALYEAFVEDMLGLCARVREAGRIDVALWTTELDHPSISKWGRALETAPRLQPEGDLGARLMAAFDDGLRAYERVVVIGSDMPTLPLELIVAAFDGLERAPMVLGPSNDGGYYAVGATHDTKLRFDRIEWSTPSALRDTLRANAELGPRLLPPWYDVDEPEDLEILRAHLSVSPGAAPATARFLRTLSRDQR